MDNEGTIRFANPAARRMFGREIEGTTLGVPLAPNGTVEVGIHGPSGTEGHAEMRLTPLSWQGQSATLASLRDVTDRERARRELQQERDFVAALLENLAALVMIVSPDLTVKRLNRSCLEACGLAESATVGQPLSEVFPGLEKCLAQDPRPEECESDANGVVIAWRMRDFGDHLVCTGYDITERKRDQELLEKQNEELKEARLEAEAGSRAKTQFLAMMSHELRTPMSAVLGMLELLSESSLEKRQLDYVRLADTGARELLGVLDDILDISKIEAGHIQIRPLPFSLPRALARLVGVLEVEARRGQCSLHLDCPTDIPDMVLGDWGRLRQVLLNLLGNALKFCDDDCGLRVRLLDSASPYRLQFSVWDTGDGIAEEDRERIFQPFVQVDGSLSRSHEGTGLGLAIAASLVERMGGELRLESQVGQGSTFSFELTLEPAPEPLAKARPHGSAVSVRVLLVDDNPISRRVAGLMLENWGYQVDTVENGGQALQRLTERAHDVLLLDIQMPGMNGYEVLEILRRRERDNGQQPIPVVALTAHCVKGEHDRALEAGMDGFLTKPVDRALLHEALSRLFPDLV